ncbi:MAG: hypothetical protein ACLGG7_08555 [Bacteriovoracia bacterium]
MKLWIVLFLLVCAPAYADYCQCEVFATSPLSVSNDVDPYPVGEIRGSYFGKFDAESQRTCRQECQTEAMREYDAAYLREKLTPWVRELVSNGVAGYNCTGSTDFKIPVRVRARIGKFSLGLAHESMVFLSYNRSCF